MPILFSWVLVGLLWELVRHGFRLFLISFARKSSVLDPGFWAPVSFGGDFCNAKPYLCFVSVFDIK